MDQSPSLGEKQNLTNFRRRAFELCLAIYRVTRLFPPGEVLAKQLRKASSDIIVSLATGQIRDTILKVEAIKIYLAIAKKQDWLKPINFDLLRSAYSLLAEGLLEAAGQREEMTEKRDLATPPPKLKKEPPEFGFSGIGQRQKLIMDYLNKNRQAKVSDLLKILGGISERTIRNDLTSLIGKNLIRKIGSRKDARYLLI